MHYDDAYGNWEINGASKSVRDFYRIAYREMAAITGFRTAYPAIIPPGAAHVNTVNSLGAPTDLTLTAGVGAYLSSIVLDFYVRSAGTGHIFADLIRSAAFPYGAGIWELAVEPYLRLNCMTEAYGSIWEEVMGTAWSKDVPLRTSEKRLLAQIDIDAVVAVSLGITAEELCMIYRTQFPIMRRYDRDDRFDANGRKVVREVLKRESLSHDGGSQPKDERTWLHPQSGVSYIFEYPFRVFDREELLTKAHARFSEVLCVHSSEF